MTGCANWRLCRVPALSAMPRQAAIHLRWQPSLLSVAPFPSFFFSFRTFTIALYFAEQAFT